MLNLLGDTVLREALTELIAVVGVVVAVVAAGVGVMVTVGLSSGPVGLTKLPSVAELAAHLHVLLDDGVQFAHVLGSISL